MVRRSRPYHRNGHGMQKDRNVAQDLRDMPQSVETIVVKEVETVESTPRWIGYSFIALVITFGSIVAAISDNLATTRTQLAEARNELQSRLPVLAMVRENNTSLRVLEDRLNAVKEELNRRATYLPRLDVLEVLAAESRQRIRDLEDITGRENKKPAPENKRMNEPISWDSVVYLISAKTRNM